jgi:uncharacterized membrane protein
MTAKLDLGSDPVLTNGIEATGQMEDDSIGPQQSTDFIVSVSNKSNTPVPNYRVFVNRLAGSVNVSPSNVIIPLLSPGETEECHFQVRNSTNNVQTNYTFRVRSTYFGSITHTYNNFVRS